jgi:hypothetical protein
MWLTWRPNDQRSQAGPLTLDRARDGLQALAAAIRYADGRLPDPSARANISSTIPDFASA